jgi:hypothetical protein
MHNHCQLPGMCYPALEFPQGRMGSAHHSLLPGTAEQIGVPARMGHGT